MIIAGVIVRVVSGLGSILVYSIDLCSAPPISLAAPSAMSSPIASIVLVTSVRVAVAVATAVAVVAVALIAILVVARVISSATSGSVRPSTLGEVPRLSTKEAFVYAFVCLGIVGNYLSNDSFLSLS